MCAWWTGQPIYGSNPASKFVRENFAYLKALTDLLSLSAVTQADLTKLHAIVATAAQVDRNLITPAIGNLGTFLDTTGVKTVTLTYEPSVVIFFATLSTWSPTNGGWSIGFDDGATHNCIHHQMDMTDEHNLNISTSYSIYVPHATVSPERYALISAKNATGFSITVTAVGVQTGYKGIYLALP
jgi:hypothetical protein